MKSRVLRAWVVSLGTALAMGGVGTERAAAQRYDLRNYSVEHGLAQSEVHDMLQDGDGYLWLATSSGLSRFDGNSFETFTAADGLADDLVHAIAETPDGMLWFGTERGLSRYDGISFTTMTSREGLEEGAVSAVLVTRGGALWAGTAHGPARFDGARFTYDDHAPQLLRETSIRSLVEDHEGTLWFAAWSAGVFRYDGSAYRYFGVEDGLPRAHTLSLHEDRWNRLWVGTSQGLRRVEGDRLVLPPGAQALEGRVIFSFLDDPEGGLWIGTDRGVARFDGRRLEFWTERQGLSASSVFSLFRDREGNLWFGTSGGGVDQLRSGAFTHLSKEDGLPASLVMAVHQDPDGTIWVGTESGAARIDEDGAVHHPTPAEGVCHCFVRAFHRDRRGDLWIGSDEGVTRYDGKSFRTFDQRDGLSYRKVRAITEDREGNLWFATFGGATRFDGSRFEPFLTTGERAYVSVGAIHSDAAGRLWFGTSRGLLAFDGGAFTPPRDGGEILATAHVQSIAEDDEGGLWVGTSGDGVVRYKPASRGAPARVERITTAHGLSANTAYFLLFDGAGSLWIGTPRGLDRLDAAAFLASGARSIRSYGSADGYFGVESNHGAALKASDGSLWFGTIKGAVRYDPSEDRFNRVEPLTRITGLQLYRAPTDWIALGYGTQDGLPVDLHLPYDSNHLTFDYLAVSLTVPEEVRYHYRLEGVDRDWSPATRETSATYPSLPPGEYTFAVKACNNDGVCNQQAVSYRFVILPPFWRTGWFLLLASTSLVLFAHGGHRLRVRNLTRQRIRLERTVVERTAELERANRELDRLARTDRLTGLANRGAFDEHLGNEWRRSQRSGAPLSLVLADIDCFKLLNDSQGHQAGDRCLEAVAALFRKAARRAGDLAARYGGEEFVLVYPETEAEDARRLAERIRARVESLAIPHPASRVGDIVTISAGVATLIPAPGVSPDSLTRAADEALYRAKEAGRNRVSMASDSSTTARTTSSKDVFAAMLDQNSSSRSELGPQG